MTVDAGVITLVSELQTVLDSLQTERDELLADKELTIIAQIDQMNVSTASIIFFDFDQTIAIFLKCVNCNFDF